MSIGELTRDERSRQVAELTAEGWSRAEVAELLGVACSTVYADLVRLRERSAPIPLDVSPERAAIAFTADRGWHVVQAPPAWFLDLLAEVD
ncbi:hypothetical protein DQ244_01650 [Blastococcus sp. TBT05-19]|uniref:hypothetical protein n=1 Tax=Blastococcus sp. TBT05-19 TaxID=2250581 RepID=UPI000DE94BA8|nr:hypothetical protein [Blastococcus sp. TBT05-19]RBY94092.1 hypothetical protein DQ244_01650 [Blastococcus sp. TBT05-19]